ncbi:unnamed protein product [Paramecium octaurelia]|uniref:Tetratricopeptide repeat protein n=1 Tax=Paramecium octaurelia TaxID=43137 RepID=A0A8S1XUG7_PAROT|nr:unnamed protein product [Paramecium octaurelia]
MNYICLLCHNSDYLNNIIQEKKRKRYKNNQQNSIKFQIPWNIEQEVRARIEAKIDFLIGRILVDEGNIKVALEFFDESIQKFDQDDNVYQWKGFVLKAMKMNIKKLLSFTIKLFQQIKIKSMHGIIREINLKYFQLGSALDLLIIINNLLSDMIKPFLQILRVIIHETTMVRIRYSLIRPICINIMKLSSVITKLLLLNSILIVHGIIKGIKFEYFYFGLALQQLKQYQDAIMCFVKATFINPKNEYAWKIQVYNLSIYFFFRFNFKLFKQIQRSYCKLICANSQTTQDSTILVKKILGSIIVLQYSSFWFWSSYEIKTES